MASRTFSWIWLLLYMNTQAPVSVTVGSYRQDSWPRPGSDKAACWLRPYSASRSTGSCITWMPIRALGSGLVILYRSRVCWRYHLIRDIIPVGSRKSVILPECRLRLWYAYLLAKDKGPKPRYWSATLWCICRRSPCGMRRQIHVSRQCSVDRQTATADLTSDVGLLLQRQWCPH